MKKTKIEDMDVIIHFHDDKKMIKMIYRKIAALKIRHTRTSKYTLGRTHIVSLFVITMQSSIAKIHIFIN